jgi:hypothetical protein
MILASQSKVFIDQPSHTESDEKSHSVYGGMLQEGKIKVCYVQKFAFPLRW